MHEGSTKYEVKNDKEDSVVEKGDLITKKDMEHKDLTREKEKLKVGSPQYEREFWKVKSDIEDSDEVQEITAARTPMKNNRPVCVTCDQTLALKNGCKKSYWARGHWALVKLLWQNVPE